MTEAGQRRDTIMSLISPLHNHFNSDKRNKLQAAMQSISITDASNKYSTAAAKPVATKLIIFAILSLLVVVGLAVGLLIYFKVIHVESSSSAASGRKDSSPIIGAASNSTHSSSSTGSFSPVSALPKGNLTFWTQVLAEDFLTDAPVGQFQSTYSQSWCGYSDSGKYWNNFILSAKNGLMLWNLSAATQRGGAGSFGPPHSCWGARYGKYSMRVRAINATGWGTAVMIWPSSDVWQDGEIDCRAKFNNSDYFRGSFSSNCGKSNEN
jgi:hypothetical protein